MGDARVRILAYADRLSGRPGEAAEIKVSCEGLNRYEAELVRIIQGDINPQGPGYRERRSRPGPWRSLRGTFPAPSPRFLRYRRRQRGVPSSFDLHGVRGDLADDAGRRTADGPRAARSPDGRRVRTLSERGRRPRIFCRLRRRSRVLGVDRGTAACATMVSGGGEPVRRGRPDDCHATPPRAASPAGRRSNCDP